MKRTINTFAVISLVLVCFCACQKENNTRSSKYTFRAIADNSVKTHLDGSLNVVWDEDDDLMISDGTSNVRFTIDNLQGNSATFGSNSDTVLDGASYYAVHPASAFVDYNHVTIPSIQHYSENSMNDAPMYAVSNDHTLQFSNLCSAVNLSLQKTGAEVKEITITANKRITGNFQVESVSEDGVTKYQVRAADDATVDSITLECEGGVSITSEKNFIIYLPVGDYSRFEITIRGYNESHADFSFKATTDYPALQLNRGHIKKFQKNGGNLIFQSKYTTKHLFSISSTQQVYFSNGNLQWDNGTWSFAEHQHDYLGSSNSLTHIDIFTWPEEHSQFGTLASGQHNCNHTFMDWGQNVIGGDLVNTWRTLSNDEWTYLVNTRTMQNGTARTWKGTFSIGGNNVYALVIYPDDMPANGVLSASSTSASEEAYEGLRELGCAILPFAGYFQDRTNSSMPSITSVNSEGNYATSTLVQNNQYWSTKKLYRIPSNWNAGADYGTVSIAFGSSVRLVQNNY